MRQIEVPEYDDIRAWTKEWGEAGALLKKHEALLELEEAIWGIHTLGPCTPGACHTDCEVYQFYQQACCPELTQMKVALRHLKTEIQGRIEYHKRVREAK